jgi:hypothetical protein
MGKAFNLYQLTFLHYAIQKNFEALQTKFANWLMTTLDDQDFHHLEVDDRPAIYSFVYSLKESFVGKNLLCKAVNVRIC